LTASNSTHDTHSDSHATADAAAATASPARTALEPAPILALIVAVIVVGLNLRPTITSVGPLLEAIRSGLGMSASSIGFLITLPVLCFGLFAPLAPRLLRYGSAEQGVLLSLLTLVLGVGLRSVFGAVGLFAGTLLAGIGISVIMVLLPSIIKQRAPQRAGLMMGLYSMTICMGAAIGAGATVPLQNLAGGDWRPALAFWLIPALLAALIWSRQLREAPMRAGKTGSAVRGLFSSWLAWQVTFYTGLQAVLAYCVFGWLPAILIDRGMTPLTAGFVLSTSISMQLVTALSGPWLATRGRDQRFMSALMMVLTFVGLLGCMMGPMGGIWVWAVVLGLGQGGCLSLSLLMLVLRSPSMPVAAALAGMAQGIGYTMAALGPLIVGFLREYNGNWNGAALFFTLASLAGLASGLSAGRARVIKVSADTTGPDTELRGARENR